MPSAETIKRISASSDRSRSASYDVDAEIQALDDEYQRLADDSVVGRHDVHHFTMFGNRQRPFDMARLSLVMAAEQQRQRVSQRRRQRRRRKRRPLVDEAKTNTESTGGAKRTRRMSRIAALQRQQHRRTLLDERSVDEGKETAVDFRLNFVGFTRAL